MPQIQVFSCPSCGASLSYEGGPETTVTCQFCGTNVVIPEELRSRAAPPPQAMPPLAPAAGGQPDQAALLALLEQLASHAASASPDKAARAAALLAGLEEIASQVAAAQGATGHTTDVRQAAIVAVEQLARAGQKTEAITVYRLITGAGPQEAQNAVEAMAAAGGQPSWAVPAPISQPGMERVEQLVHAGQKMEAIRVYRQMTGAGLREAANAVEAMIGGGGQQPGPRPMPAPQPRRARRGGGCGCFPVLLLIAGFLIVIGYLPYRLSGSYAKVLAAAQADPAVVKALGEPVEADWWLWGSRMSCGSTCSGRYMMGLRGSQSSGQVSVNATMRRGGNFFDAAAWTVSAIVTTNAGETITVGAGRSAQPTQVAMATQAPRPAPATQVPAPTKALPTATPNLPATAEAMSGEQGPWPPTSAINLAAPFKGWPIGTKQDDAIAVTTTTQAKGYLFKVFPKHSSSYMNFFADNAGPLTDFYAMVDLTFKEGAAGNTYAYGLVFRRVNDDYGFFGLQNDGQYKLLLVEQTGIYEQIVNKSPAIKTGPGQTNTLEVRNLGSDFVFRINGVPVWGLNKDLAAGQVGLGVDVAVKGNPAQVLFSNFEVHAPSP